MKWNTPTKIITICGILHVIKRQNPLFLPSPQNTIHDHSSFSGALWELGISDHIIACEYLTISFHHFSSFFVQPSLVAHSDKVSSGPNSFFSIIIIVHLKSIEHKRSVILDPHRELGYVLDKMLFQEFYPVVWGWLETCRQNECTHDITQKTLYILVFFSSAHP